DQANAEVVFQEKNRSILGITYRLFEQLSGAQKIGLVDEMGKILLEFPSLVVFANGHTPQNDQSHMWKALSEIKTKRRILLSGTLFQNNFQELFNTICLVRPTFAASIDSTKFSRDLLKKRGQKSKGDNGNGLLWPVVVEKLLMTKRNMLQRSKLRLHYLSTSIKVLCCKIVFPG
ncbi:unnamed protein product, partial [Prunus brigantina]